MTTTDLAAALIAGVPRYEQTGRGMNPDRNGAYFAVDEVLTALTAALDRADKRAGEVLEGVTPGPWDVRKWSQKMTITGNVHQVTDKDGYPSAFVPAWDAPGPGEIDGTEEAKANARFIAWCREGVPALLAHIAAQEAQIKGHQDHVDTLNEVIDMSNATAQTLETALAAERAKVAKLVEAGKMLSAVSRRNTDDVNEWNAAIDGMEVAITEATQ